MPHPIRTVTRLVAAITGNVTDQELKQANGRSFGSAGTELGGRIVLGTATSVKILVKDADGKVLHDNTVAITATKTVDPIPTGVKGPLTVTTTDISDAAHTLTVSWEVKK